jgi:peptide/nickel transport system permease protein
VVRRLAWSLAAIVLVVSATFAMVVAIPADPARALVGAHADAGTLARARAHYCLDRSLPEQYGCYVGRLAHGDLGESYRTRRPVAEILWARAWPTVQLALAALLLQLAIGLPLGAWSAVRRGRWPDRVGGVVTLVAASVPAFVLGTLAVYVLAFVAGWFPVAGYGESFAGRLHHLMLPAMTLACAGIATYARLGRAELIEQLAADHVRTARAKGVSETSIVLRHAGRNAAAPLVAVAGVDLGVLLGGAVVTETVFAWPGLGRETLHAVHDLDLPLILGVTLLAAVAVVIVNLVADLLVMRIDPRTDPRFDGS